MSNVLLEDIFEVKNVDKDGKKFDKVSRVECKSENYEMDLVLDINTDVYRVEVNDKMTLALAKSLELDDMMDELQEHQEMAYDPELGTDSKPSLMDKFEYVTYGKVYKYKMDRFKEQKVSVYVSFGGLLMRLSGDPRNLNTISPDTHIYLLIRKAKSHKN